MGFVERRDADRRRHPIGIEGGLPLTCVSSARARVIERRSDKMKRP
jgi:hypothetical protein